jgi:hypothetical protein
MQVGNAKPYDADVRARMSVTGDVHRLARDASLGHKGDHIAT